MKFSSSKAEGMEEIHKELLFSKDVNIPFSKFTEQTDDNRIKVSEINARTQNLQTPEGKLGRHNIIPLTNHVLEFLVDMQKIALADIKRRPKSPLVERILAISKVPVTTNTIFNSMLIF